MRRVKLRLLQLNQHLSHFKAYNLLKASRLVSLVVLSFGIIYLLSWNIPVDKGLEQLTESFANSSWSSSFISRPIDEPQNIDQQKFIFINNKYPTPKGYANILEDEEINPEEFMNKPLGEKCFTYFSKLNDRDPEWSLNSLEKTNHPYNGFIFDTKDRFLNDRLNEYKNSLDNKDSISDEELKELVKKFGKNHEWEAAYAKAFQESYDSEKYMTDQMTNLRVFAQCYLDESIDEIEQNIIDTWNKTLTFDSIEQKLFKFLTREFPTYTRWNREVLSVPPVIKDYLNDDNHTTTSDLRKASGCFVRDLKDSYNGKGIVISAADMHLDELSSLILVLRGLTNKLPIQIVHRGDLSEKSQAALTRVARSQELNLDEIRTFKKLIQSKFEDVRELSMDLIFPPQEIWYVDATLSVDPTDDRFVTYGNKLLSLLFSSFEDTVLIDTDTVPFVDIDQSILQSSVYQNLGAFFFKDRQLYDRMTGPELTYFRKLLPTRLDTAFFNIPELTEFTYKNRFFGDHFKHIQESGMVAINKKKHFRSTLTINVLQLWHAATTRVHGDKELFWLGFSIAGDEDYYLNKHGVGAVGTINPKYNRLLDDSDDHRRSRLKSNMVCTTHPAHLSGLDDHTLLWMNSGFITCKRPDEATNDIKMNLYKNIFENEHQLRQSYTGPLKINAIIVPPPQENIVNNDLGEPSAGWEVMFGCGGYLYCAYDNVGASDKPEHKGTLVEYDQDQVLWYYYLGEIWVNYEKILNTPVNYVPDLESQRILDE